MPVGAGLRGLAVGVGDDDLRLAGRRGVQHRVGAGAGLGEEGVDHALEADAEDGVVEVVAAPGGVELAPEFGPESGLQRGFDLEEEVLVLAGVVGRGEDVGCLDPAQSLCDPRRLGVGQHAGLGQHHAVRAVDAHQRLAEHALGVLVDRREDGAGVDRVREGGGVGVGRAQGHVSLSVRRGRRPG